MGTESMRQGNKREKGLLLRLVEALEYIGLQLFLLRTGNTWMTLEEAERYAHVRHGIIGEAAKNGELEGRRREGGRTRLVDARDIDRWMRTWQESTDAVNQSGGGRP